MSGCDRCDGPDGCAWCDPIERDSCPACGAVEVPGAGVTHDACVTLDTSARSLAWTVLEGFATSEERDRWLALDDGERWALDDLVTRARKNG